MKTFITLALAMFAFFTTMAQNFSYEYQGPQTTAQYMEGYDLDVNAMVYTATITANDQNTSTFYINHITTDANGQLQNLFKYRGVDNNLSLLPKHTISLSDGSQLISGTCYPDFEAGLGKPFVMSIASNGSVNWAKTIDHLDGSPPFIKVLSDGSVLCIFKYSEDNIDYFKAFCKIDANGNFSNFKQYPLGFDHPREIIANSNGTFDVMTAQGHLLNVNNDLSAINWIRKYYTEGGLAFNRTQNGDYIFATSQIVFGHSTLFRTDANGNVIWAKQVETFEGMANNPFQVIDFDFIEEDSQGNITAAALQINSHRTMYISLDANGNFLSNFSTNTGNNASLVLNNGQLLLFSLNTFPSFNFQLEKRDLDAATICDNTNVSHNIFDGNAMEQTPPSLSLTTIPDFATVDINIAFSNEPETIDQVVFCNLSLSENELPLSDITVYPNPTSGNIHIESNQKIDHIKLYDATGRLIKTSRQTSMNIAEHSTGYYILEILIGDRPYYKKIIKK